MAAVPWHIIEDQEDTFLQRPDRVCRPGARGIFVTPVEANFTRVHCVVLGPAQTPFEKGFWHVLVKFPADYPSSPPRLLNLTTDAGNVCLHPRLPGSGRVDLKILKTSGQDGAWSPPKTPKDVLCALRYELTKTESSRHGTREQRRLFDTIRHETVRVAVCGNMEAWLGNAPNIPQQLRVRVCAAFFAHHEWYVTKMQKNVHLDGQKMSTSLGDIGNFHHELLVQQLQNFLQVEIDFDELDNE
ncbi:hypothetical protein HPB52_013626 [Rhipicephalus sanguineus]|uniref:UBC core domain-containing protein n=1 Tax=Rhipicephalus sanguineus TaxID=34632 RepID=A0A9D4PWC3_RHISA|nr:hypothetical protein HPB52_013626 [Rhipicephalus sanguineus]